MPGGHLPLLATVDFEQLLLEVVDPLFHEPAIDLELLLARAAHADPHLQPRQMRPHPFEAGQRIFKLRQFDREPGLVGPRPGCEDVEDHL